MTTAGEVLRLLRDRHAKDFGLAECKMGSTWLGSGMRMDYWAMAKSWAKWKTWGYEIKVSRQDFLRDDKWREYLPYCHEFYFVAPPGIIEPNELPAEAGLLVTSKNVTRLYRKKKPGAVREDIDKAILIYALMWRAGGETREERAASWAEWLAQKKTYKDLGQSCQVEMAKLAQEARRMMEVERHRQKREAEKYEDLRQLLESRRLSISYRSPALLAQELEGSAGIRELRRSLTALTRAIDATTATLAEALGYPGKGAHTEGDER